MWVWLLYAAKAWTLKVVDKRQVSKSRPMLKNKTSRKFVREKVSRQTMAVVTHLNMKQKLQLIGHVCCMDDNQLADKDGDAMLDMVNGQRPP